MIVVQIIILLLSLIVIGLFLYWLLVLTEGAYLGRRTVVWLYDKTAHKYDGIKEFEPDAESFFLIRPLRHRLKNIPNPLILDVATGTGRLPYFLLEDPLFNGRIIGLDPSRKMLNFAAAKLKPYGYRAGVVQQTAVPLPFPANTFDAVTCLEALEFFPSDQKAIAEMLRVLKPNGIILVTRRRGRDGKLFPRRYKTVQQFEAMLSGLGTTAVQTMPWQLEYDQVYGRKASSG